jgi:hypothetical protein
MPEMTAERWNDNYPPGTRVIAYPCCRPKDGKLGAGCKRLDTTTRSRAWNLGHGDPVVMVEGYAGGIAPEHIDVVPQVEETNR